MILSTSHAGEESRTIRVAVSSDLAEMPVAEAELRGQLSRPWISWTFVDAREGELVLDDDYEAAIVFTPRVTVRTLTPSLRLIARLGVGFETTDLEACRSRGVTVTITPNAVRLPMASGAVAMLLALAHNLVVKDQIARSGRWELRNQLIGLDLSGKVAGFVGFGNIGREVARLLAPWNMQVVACRSPGRAPTDGADEMSLFVEFEQVLRRADVLFVVCPLTDETRGLIGREQLALLKPSALLVNIARGPIVDENALVELLEGGSLRGAALDVFSEEPLPSTHPLTRLENVVLAPHSIGHIDSLFRAGVESVLAELAALREGRLPLHPVP